MSERGKDGRFAMADGSELMNRWFRAAAAGEPFDLAAPRDPEPLAEKVERETARMARLAGIIAEIRKPIGFRPSPRPSYGSGDGGARGGAVPEPTDMNEWLREAIREKRLRGAIEQRILRGELDVDTWSE